MPSGCQTGHSVRFFQKRLQSYMTNYFVSMFCYVCHALILSCFRQRVAVYRDVIDRAPKVAEELHVAQKRSTSGQEASVGRHAGSLPMPDRGSGKAYGNGKGFSNAQFFTSASWPALRGRYQYGRTVGTPPLRRNRRRWLSIAPPWKHLAAPIRLRISELCTIPQHCCRRRCN